MAKNSPNKSFPDKKIMTFSKKTIRTTSIPYIRKIHSHVWKLEAQNSKIGLKWTKFCYSMAKNSHYQKFPDIQSMIFSKRTTKTTSKPKIRKIHRGVWKLMVKQARNAEVSRRRPNNNKYAQRWSPATANNGHNSMNNLNEILMNSY